MLYVVSYYIVVCSESWLIIGNSTMIRSKAGGDHGAHFILILGSILILKSWWSIVSVKS